MENTTNEIMQGEMCEICHMYFEDSHGYPATCLQCYKNLDEDMAEDTVKAIYPLID